jgi:TPP-dependent 2-oxoacid decarboxylase
MKILWNETKYHFDMTTKNNKVIRYTHEESKSFPRQFKVISLKEALKQFISLIPKKGNETKPFNYEVKETNF